MGFSQSWLAVKSSDFDQVLELMQLRRTGEFSEVAENGWSCIDMQNGWTVLVEEHFKGTSVCERLDVLTPLSHSNEVISAFVEEHVMFSHCSVWKNGVQIWKIEHESLSDKRHLLVEGQTPECFEGIKSENLKLQEGVEDTDYIFEIPVAVGQRLCGYKHDQVPTGVSEQPFEILESLAPKPAAKPSSKTRPKSISQPVSQANAKKVEKPGTLADLIRSFFKPKN